LLRYLIRRIPQAVIVMWGVLTVIFILVRLSGDPVTLFIVQDTPVEQIEAIRRELHLDKPLYIQYLIFLQRAAVGDFGDSLRHRQPALGLVIKRLPASLELMFTAVVFSVLIGIPTGIICATKRGSLADSLSLVAVLLGQSTPGFWLGTMLMLFFALKLRILPAAGYGDINQFVLPTLTLAAYLMARITRITRSELLDILREDYIRTARAKGVREAIVVCRHALKNAAITIVTVVGLDASAVLAGAIITETLFAWPGVGRLLVAAVLSRDFPVVQATALVLALFVVSVNTAIDITYTFLNPKVRLER